jgi:uncharacterized protein (DUF924 family)
MRPRDVIEFWFAEPNKGRWFEPSPEFDRAIEVRFRALYEDAAAGELAHWRDSADGCLALCLLLDQFPRNMFRGDARAFATDAMALEIAAHALARGFDQALPSERRSFLYLPFEHSEDLAHQNRCVALIGDLNDSKLFDYAVRHQRIIERFGRFPHRNRILGRATTAEEAAFLETLGSSFR